MKQLVLTTIVTLMLSCSLLLAEDAATQQTQPVSQGSKITCCKMKNCKSIGVRAERAAAKLKAKAQKCTKLADLYTNCANAQQKVADAAKAAATCNCMGICKADKDTAATDIEKQCKEVCGKLTAAQEEAAKAFNALTDYKKVGRKISTSSRCIAPASDSSESSF